MYLILLYCLFLLLGSIRSIYTSHWQVTIHSQLILVMLGFFKKKAHNVSISATLPSVVTCKAISPYLFSDSNKLCFLSSGFPFSLAKVQNSFYNFKLSPFAARNHAGCPTSSWCSNNLYFTWI